MNTCIIDFRQVRPLSASDTPGTSPMKLRLCAQVWPNGQSEGRVVDCCCCEAMELSPNLPVISMADLAFGRVPLGVSEEQAEEAARIFASNLKKETGDVEIVCIIPDATSDFELVTVRNQLKANFSSVDFLPVSIGAVFDWVARTGHEVTDKELMVVADATPEGLQLTPVQAVYDKDTERMVWERHPGKLIPAESFFKKIRAEIKNCHFPEQFSEFPGWNGLASEAGKLTLHHGERWYELQEHLAETFSGISINRKDLESHISELAKGLTDREPTLLCATELLSWTKMARSLLCSACDGGCIWAARQQQDSDLVQWYDYLPELSIEVMHKGRFELFPLVSRENRRIEPRRGKAVELSIPNHFTLPAGAKICSFPLFRGNGGTALRFTAEVHSPAFPLKKKEDCRLKLTYTYGAPKPYQLTFEGSFGTANTTWQPMPDPTPDIPGKIPLIVRRELASQELLNSICETLTPYKSLYLQGSYIKPKLTARKDFYILVSIDEKFVKCYASDFYEDFPTDIQRNDPVYIYQLVTNTIHDKSNNKVVEFNRGYGITFSKPLESPLSNQPPAKRRMPNFKKVCFSCLQKAKDIDAYHVMATYHDKKIFIQCNHCSDQLIPSMHVEKGKEAYCIIADSPQEPWKSKGYCFTLTKPQEPGFTNPSAFYPDFYFNYRKQKDEQIAFQGSPPPAPLFKKMAKAFSPCYGAGKLPTEFTSYLESRINELLQISGNLQYGSPMWLNHLTAALCTMGARAPEPARIKMITNIQEAIASGRRIYYPVAVAGLVGELREEWQCTLFQQICGCLGNCSRELCLSAYQVCSAVLHNQRKLPNLSLGDVRGILEQATEVLRRKCEQLKVKDNSENELSYIVRTIEQVCRTLCLVMEFRKSKAREMRFLVCLRSRACQEIQALLKEIHNQLFSFKIPYHRVLAPSAYEGMFLPLYQLFVLLCDNAESATITIEEEDDSEEEEEDISEDDGE